MSIEAPVSRFRKNNLKIYIAVCIVATLWLGYDGYFNKKFKEGHTGADGKADSTLAFNQKAPPFFVGAAVLFGVYLGMIRNKKLVADENELVIGGKKKIAYGSIKKIDKTHFSSKGHFIITYKDEGGNEVNWKAGDKDYDNLAAILDQLVAKIS
jgi:hypothetical protein